MASVRPPPTEAPGGGRAPSNANGFRFGGLVIGFVLAVLTSIAVAFQLATWLAMVVGDDKADMFFVCEVVIVCGCHWHGQNLKRLEQLESKVDELNAMLREEIKAVRGDG